MSVPAYDDGPEFVDVSAADETWLYEQTGESGGELEPRVAPWSSVPWSEFRDTSPIEIEYLIADIQTRGGLGFIGGAPKQGKTWIALIEAVCIATGRSFLGHEIPKPETVLYVALEGSQAGIRARIGAIARGLGIDPDSDELDRLHVLYKPQPFNLTDPGLAELLIAEAQRIGAAIVFVDVLREASRGGKENSAEDFALVRDALRPLTDADCSVQLLHHFGKASETQRDRAPGERMAGTGAMYGALDVGLWITLAQNGARKFRVEPEAKDFAAADPFGVALVGTGSGPNGGFTYADSILVELDASAAEERDLVYEIEQLFADGKWRTVKEIAETKEGGIGSNESETRRLLESSPERFARVEPGLVGRHSSSKPWGSIAMLERVRQTPESPESPGMILGVAGTDRTAGDSGASLTGTAAPDAPAAGSGAAASELESPAPLVACLTCGDEYLDDGRVTCPKCRTEPEEGTT